MIVGHHLRSSKITIIIVLFFYCLNLWLKKETHMGSTWSPLIWRHHFFCLNFHGPKHYCCSFLRKDLPSAFCLIFVLKKTLMGLQAWKDKELIFNVTGMWLPLSLVNIHRAIHLITVAKSKIYWEGLKSIAFCVKRSFPKQYFLLPRNTFTFCNCNKMYTTHNIYWIIK